MNQPTMGIKLATEFSQDALFKTLAKLGMQEMLFDNHMEDLSDQKDYQTTEFEKWYCANEEEEDYLCTGPTMRHWLKELNGYIEARSIGRNLSLDYKAIFRLKMILLLRKENYKMPRIAEMVGIRAISPVIVMENQNQSQEIIHPSVRSNFSEEELNLFQGFIAQLSSGQFNEYIVNLVKENQQLMLPGEEKINELEQKLEQSNRELLELREATEKYNQTLEKQEKELEETKKLQSDIARKVSDDLEGLRSKLKTDEEWKTYQETVSELRISSELRHQSLTEDLNKIREQNNANELKQEIINSLPWIVRKLMRK
ncbi:hypothetical protein LJR153_007103 [Paenibacillus sp. LjRoot153]|uniref:hypothetical protein n=1 Tax=Paenibacillus sp. LjRoot153 TaxID=3342270 RepID=UPI003ECE3CC4